MEEGNYNDDKAIQELMLRLENSESKNIQLSSQLATIGSEHQGGNLVQYQLDSVDLLDSLRNFYSGKYPAYDDEGNLIMKTPENTDLIPLNEFGVNSMMEIVSKYIDKNTTLSTYGEERIYEILGDLGDELTLFMFCNYEKMGMDTHFKKTKFRVLILSTLHIIESTYRRAFRGDTMKGLNESRIVTQSDLVGQRAIPQMPQNKGNAFANLFKI